MLFDLYLSRYCFLALPWLISPTTLSTESSFLPIISILSLNSEMLHSESLQLEIVHCPLPGQVPKPSTKIETIKQRNIVDVEPWKSQQTPSSISEVRLRIAVSN